MQPLLGQQLARCGTGESLKSLVASGSNVFFVCQNSSHTALRGLQIATIHVFFNFEVDHWGCSEPNTCKIIIVKVLSTRIVYALLDGVNVRLRSVPLPSLSGVELLSVRLEDTGPLFSDTTDMSIQIFPQYAQPLETGPAQQTYTLPVADSLSFSRKVISFLPMALTQ